MYLNPIRHITVDAHDPHVLARFWAQVTGLRLDPETERSAAERGVVAG